MKKATRILAIVLTLVLTVALFAGCKTGTKKSLKNQLIGKWEADLSGIAELMGEDADALEAMIELGIEYSLTMEFKKDGTGQMAMLVTYNGENMDEKEDFKWSLDGDKLTVEMEDEDDDEETPTTIKIEGNKMTMTTVDDDGETVKMVFTRVK